jgi:hypothetical protein
MKKIFSVLMVAFFATALLSVTACGQTTYTWTGATDNNWLTTTNWSPTRTTPATNDIIQFNAGGTVTVIAVPTQTIGQLLVSGASIVNLTAAGAVTLTITGTGSVLSVASGSALNCNGPSAILINITTGGTGSISGTMTFSGTTHKLTAVDAGGVTFQNGSTFTQGTSNTGNVFGSASTQNSIVFASGSTFVFTTGSNPFALTAPASVVVFQTGSTFSHQSTNTPSFNGRTYANFQLNIGSSITVTGPSAVSIDNLTLTAGTLNFNMTAAPGHAIKGNISVASGTVLNFNPGAAGTVNFGGSALQTISGAGTITSGVSSTLNVNNAAGVSLGTNLSLMGNLAMSQGNIALGGNTLTLGSAGGTINTTGNTTSGSATISPVASTAGVVVGMSVTGTGIPAGATVLSFVTNTSITLTASATATGSGVALAINSVLGGTLTYTGGFLTGAGTFTRWFANGAISGNAGLFPMGVGSNNRSLVIGGSPSPGGSIPVSYNDASTVSSITFTEDQNYVKRYDANWVVGTLGGGYTDGAMTLTIHGDGIPGITSVADLDLSAASVIATGVWAAPSGSTSAPVLTRTGLTQGTIVVNPFYIASTNTSPLPVELTSFTALAGKNSVELAWNTATEVNNYGFDIERAIHSGLNGLRDWQKIGFVSGNGNSNAPHNYSFTDNSAMFGTYSYRLKQIDRNGNFEYSKEVEAAVTMTPNTIVLGQNYPNPFNPETNIEFAVPISGYTTLKVYNTLGEEITTLVNGNIEAGVLHQVTFKGSNFPSGLYFYTLRSGSFVETKKMLMIK